jgi:hypothetical protein
MSVFTKHNLLFMRDPAGGVEDVQMMKDAGYGMVACNVQKEIPPGRWDLVRGRAANAGVISVPWCYIWNLEDLQRLISIADQWGVPPLVNVEKQLDLGVFSTQDIANMLQNRDAAFSTEAWLYGAVDWSPIAHWPMMLQIFPLESQSAKDPEGCRVHAHASGFSCVMMTYGTYDVNDVYPQPDWYDLRTPFQIYTADDLTHWYPNYGIWSPTGTYNPCKDVVEPLPESEFPFTGPYYPLTPYPGFKKMLPDRGKTVKALKLIYDNLGMMDAGTTPNNVYGATLRNTVYKWQQQVGIDPPTGNYGKKTWESLRTAQVDGEYVVRGEALKLIQEDAQDG